MTDRRARRSRDPAPTPPPASKAAPAKPPFRPEPWHVAAGLAVLHLLLAWLAYVPMPFAGGDNGTYLSLARSLVEGTGYRDVWDPAGGPHTLYPPVFPVILAAAMKLGLATEPALKWVVVLFSVAAVAFSYLWARRVTTPGIALAAGVTLAVAPGVIDLTKWVLSDVPFWTFAMLALWAFARRVPARRGDGEAETEGGRGWLALGVAAILLAHFTRSAGLPLVVATGAYLLLRRRWADAGVLAAVIVPAVAAWSAYGRASNAAGYLDAFRFVDPYDRARGTLTLGDFFARVGENVGGYLGEEIPVALFFDLPPAALLLGTVFTGLAIAGWAMRLRRPGLAELWIPLHVGLLLVWPAAWSGARFVLPILAPMLVYAAETVAWIGARAGKPRYALIPAAAVLALLLAKPLVMQVRYGQECSSASAETGWLTCLLPMWQSYFAVAEGVRGRLPEGAVVLSRKPTIFYAVSGYRSSLYPLTDKQDSIFAFADSVGAEWVLADQVPDLAPRYLHPLLFTHRDEFCLVNDMLTPGAILLRIDRDRTKGTRENGPQQMRECPLDPRYITAGLTPPGAFPMGGDSARAGGQGPGT